MNIHKLDGSTPRQECDGLEGVSLDEPIVFGGGGLLYYRTVVFNWHKIFSFAKKNSRAKIVCWSIGRNSYCKTNIDELLKDIGMVGMRSVEDKYRFVPCPSCMSLNFDKKYVVEHEVIVYEHYENPIPFGRGLPRKKNAGNLASTIQFIASGDTVITNTYHGLYWATLLGKKVILTCLDGSDRFSNFPFAPICWDGDELSFGALVNRAKRYDESLEVCREANIAFAKDVANFLEIDLKPVQNSFDIKI
jgi:hypothetical protein